MSKKLTIIAIVLSFLVGVATTSFIMGKLLTYEVLSHKVCFRARLIVFNKCFYFTEEDLDSGEITIGVE